MKRANKFFTNARKEKAISVGRNRDYGKNDMVKFLRRVITKAEKKDDGDADLKWLGWFDNKKDGEQIPLVKSLLHNFFGKEIPTEELEFSKGKTGMWASVAGTAKDGNLHLDVSDPDTGSSIKALPIFNLWVYLDPEYMKEYLGATVIGKVLNDKAASKVSQWTSGIMGGGEYQVGIKLRFHMDSVVEKEDGSLEAQFQVVQEATKKKRVKEVFLTNAFRDCDAMMLKELESLPKQLPKPSMDKSKSKADKALRELVETVAALGRSDQYKNGVPIKSLTSGEIDYLHGADSLARWYFYVMQQCQATSAARSRECTDRVGDFAGHELDHPKDTTQLF